MPHILLFSAFPSWSSSSFLGCSSAGVGWCPKSVAPSSEQMWQQELEVTTERIWVHVPAVCLEASLTLNGANGRVINPFRKQIYKGRSCFTCDGVKLAVAMAETLFLWWRKHCVDNANTAPPASWKILLSSLLHFGCWHHLPDIVCSLVILAELVSFQKPGLQTQCCCWIRGRFARNAWLQTRAWALFKLCWTGADAPSKSATMDGMDEVPWWYWLMSWLLGWGGKAQVMFYEGREFSPCGMSIVGWSIVGSSSLKLEVLKVWLHAGHRTGTPGHACWADPFPALLITGMHFLCLLCSSCPQTPSCTGGLKLTGVDSSWGDVT